MKSQKKFWVQDTFEVQTVQKKMWSKKILSPKKISGQKTFWVQQNFVSKTILGPTNLGFQMILGPKKCSVWLSQQYSSPLVSIKVANGSIEQHIGTILVWLCLVQLTCDYKAISVKLQLQLPTGTVLGKKQTQHGLLI